MSNAREWRTYRAERRNRCRQYLKDERAYRKEHEPQALRPTFQQIWRSMKK